jgi:hypothetical protein
MFEGEHVRPLVDKIVDALLLHLESKLYKVKINC